MRHYLNLRDAVEVADFMATVIDFLPERDRAVYQQAIDDVQTKEGVPQDKLAELARNIGVLTWPMRRTIDHFVRDEGAGQEWDVLLELVRPATALLLRRLQKNTGLKTVDDVLNHVDAELALYDEQTVEIEMLRPQVRTMLWQKNQEALESQVKKAQHELNEMRRRLKKMAQEAYATSDVQDELISKLGHYEDRIYYGGESIPLEILDKELEFEREEEDLTRAA